MGVFDPISEGVGKGVAFYLEGKRRKEDKSRYEKEQEALKELRDLQIRQTEQNMALWSPGTPERFEGSFLTRIPGEEPGMSFQRLQTQLATEKKQLGGYESPGAQRTAEQTWREKEAALDRAHAMELADLRGGKGKEEEEAVPFDESGAFNPEIFKNIADALYPGFSFRDVYDNIGLEEVRKKIRFEAIGTYGQNDPAKVNQIESSLDEWLRILFQMAETLPEEEKNRSFLEVISKVGAWLTTPIGGEPRMTRREIRKIPKMEEGPPIGVEFPAKTEPDLQVRLPTFEDKEQQLQGLTKDKGFLKNIFKKRKDQTRGLTGIMMGH